MDRYDRRCIVYADLESARDALEQASSDPVQLGTKLVEFARGLGRVLVAHVYGDIDTEAAKELRRAGCEVHVTTEEGDGSAPESIALALDAAQSMTLVPQVEVAVLLTDDAQLSELVRRLRRQGRYVVAIVPEALVEAQPAQAADRALSLEDFLAGDLPVDAPVAPPAVRPTRPRPAAVAARPLDLDTYDWSRLVLLLRDLEAKMPFVGMRWLKNKVIGPHNVGAQSMTDKQALLNRAVDDGLIETYRVGNRDESGDPVTACRLLREHPLVAQLLEDNPGPAPAALVAADAG